MRAWSSNALPVTGALLGLEEAEPPWAHAQAYDDQDDAEQDLTLQQLDDADDDENDRESPHKKSHGSRIPGRNERQTECSSDETEVT